MAIKNIEMSVYNGSSYDTLLPVTSSENVTIASAISGLFGLGADSTLTDILQKLSNAVIWDGSSTELPNGSSIVTGARIETGSYVGTGTYGASNPCSLTFDFKPDFVMIQYQSGSQDNSFYGWPISFLHNGSRINYNFGSQNQVIGYSTPDTRLRWFGNQARYQNNEINCVYIYLAIKILN